MSSKPNNPNDNDLNMDHTDDNTTLLDKSNKKKCPKKEDHHCCILDYDEDFQKKMD